MPTSDFDAQVESITGALGDATRRGIYVMVRESHDPVTASQIAEAFQIHPNVARHHLDRLLHDDFIRVSDRAVGTPTAGRPAKRYEVTEKSVTIQYSAQKYDRLAELLAEVISELDDGRADEVALNVGRQYGRKLGAEIGLPEEEGFEEAALALATSMMGSGLGASTVASENRIIAQFCPLCQTGQDQPRVVEQIDQGIVQGLLESAALRPVAIELGHPDTV
ncbi:MAG: helix-turn-helix domain-containing protein [Actinomycetia bacterium]|nr:helix-turn-helix domain-containing protein [Actinomycetes bacterium]